MRWRSLFVGVAMEEETKVFLTGLFLLIGTPLALMLMYGDWEALSSGGEGFADVFLRWPWFRASVLFTMVTVITGVAIGQSGHIEPMNVVAYAVGGIWILFFVIRPEEDTLGAGSNPGELWRVWSLILLHGFGCYLTAKFTLRQEYDGESRRDIYLSEKACEGSTEWETLLPKLPSEKREKFRELKRRFDERT